MKLYTVSTLRNGPAYADNYTSLPATGVDVESGLNFHLWYPVEIPTGLNSWFKTITTAQVDNVTIPWTPQISTEGSYEQKQNSIIQERILLIYNDSNQVIPSVKVSITDQQFTGGVMELTYWKTPGSPYIKDYYDFWIESTNPTNQFPENMYIKAVWDETALDPQIPPANEIIIENMQPYSWEIGAMRLYIVKDQFVEEDYCVIATETS